MWKPRIKEIRKSKGLYQKFVADKVHISQPILSSWENGDSYPRADRLFDLAHALDCKVDELYIREETKDDQV